MKTSPTFLAVCITLLLASSGLLGRTTYQDAKKFDQFSGANWEDAMAHLDNFALSLQNDPGSIGVVFVYGGQNRQRFEPDAWANCITDYLVKRRSIDPTRLAYVLGGYREDLGVELWQAPDKNHIPKATATIKPADVKFTGADITKWRGLCSL